MNNVTTPTEAWTVQQQGFYAPGDGGRRTYQWNFTSYCAGGTSGAPTAADGIVCVLPIGQSASVAGRYIMQTPGGLDVRQFGMQAGVGFDNTPYVGALMTAVGNPSENSGVDIIFPQVPGQTYTEYHFSQSFHVTRHVRFRCQGLVNGGGDASVRFVFPDGVNSSCSTIRRARLRRNLPIIAAAA